jgi:hypothetical protein
MYQRWDGRASATALVGISLIQILYFSEPLMYLYFRLVEFDIRQSFKETGVALSFILLFVVYSINQRRYSTIYAKLEEQYSKESSKLKAFKLVLIIVVFLLPLVFPFLVLPRK